MEKKIFNLQFTDKDLAVLDKALQQMPYYSVALLIQNINEQIANQNMPQTTELSASDLGYVRSGSEATQ